jgi:ribosomal protein S18 acetylase RimI-like enzyme
VFPCYNALMTTNVLKNNTKDNTLEFRPFQEQDREGLEEIVNQTWNYDRFGYAPEVSREFSHTDLMSCMSIATFSEVALLNGRPVGFIFGRNDGEWDDNARRASKRLVRGIRRKSFWTGTGRLLNGYRSLYERSNEKLLNGTGKDYQGELVFFAVSPEARGMGVGGRLFGDFLSYMKQCKIDTFYVFTDTTCDYSFYDRNGFKRMGEVREKAEFRRGEEICFFVYEYAL